MTSNLLHYYLGNVVRAKITYFDESMYTCEPRLLSCLASLGTILNVLSMVNHEQSLVALLMTCLLTRMTACIRVVESSAEIMGSS